MYIRKYFKSPHQSNRSRAGWKQYVWIRNNKTCGTSIGSCSTRMSQECELYWGYRMEVWECFATMWCSTSIDFICRDLNQSQLCTEPERRGGLHFTHRFELSVVIGEEGCFAVGKIVFFVCPRGINNWAILSGSVLHVEAVSNCTIIDLFRSLVTPSSIGLDN